MIRAACHCTAVRFEIAEPPEWVNVRRLMWASDFPHSDSTWPDSQAVLDEQTKGLSEQERNWICHDNVAELYGLPN